MSRTNCLRAIQVDEAMVNAFEPLLQSSSLVFLTTSELVIGVLLVGTGFALGVYSMSYVRGWLARYRTDRLASTFRMSDVFTSSAGFEAWDPTRIQIAPHSIELATHEEQVLRLLLANNGRIKQSDLIDETGWSEAKVSRLLQRMEELGDLSRIHVGRNKLILLGEFRA